MKRFPCAIALLFLGACSTTPAPHRTVSATGGEQGYYKVGRPYQINGVTYTPAFDPNYDETGIASWYAGEFTGEPTGNGELYDPNQLTAAHRTLPMPSLVRVTNLENGRVLIVRINDRGPYAQNRIIDMSRRCAQLLGFEKKGTAKVRVEIMAKESEALADAARHGQLATTIASAIETNPVVANSAPVQVASNDTTAPVVPQTPQTMEPQPEQQPATPQTSGAIERTPLADQAGGMKVVNEKTVINQETGGEAPKGQSIGGRFMPAPIVHTEAVEHTGIYIQAGAFASQENAAKLRDRLAAMGAQILPATINGHALFRVRIGPLKDVPAADARLNQVIQAGVPDAKIIVE